MTCAKPERDTAPLTAAPDTVTRELPPAVTEFCVPVSEPPVTVTFALPPAEIGTPAVMFTFTSVSRQLPPASIAVAPGSDAVTPSIVTLSTPPQVNGCCPDQAPAATRPAPPDGRYAPPVLADSCRSRTKK